VRSDAKASSAGSTSGQGTSLGSFLRGAFTTRGAFEGAAGRGAPAGASGRANLLATLCLAVAGLMALCASPALGAQTHPYTGTSFGPDGVGGTESFERLQSLTVDTAGNLYAFDGGAGKIYKFNSAEAPVNFSALGANAIEGVGGSSGGAEFELATAPPGAPAGTVGDIYVANNSQALQIYAPSGTKLGELDQSGETCGVATDPGGNLFAGVYSSTINKYTPTTNPPNGAPTATATVEGAGLCNVAADGLGNVYAANYSGNGLYKLEGLADPTPIQVDSSANTMAIDGSNNDLYADRGNEVLQYSSSGALIGSFAVEEISGSHGVAVNSGASKVYVGTPGKIKVFGPFVTVPDATTEAPDAITKTTATLHGSVGAAGGPAATCVFQYATATAFDEHGFEGAGEKPCSPAGPFTGAGTNAVSATASGLSAETNYRFRLLSTSSNGSNGSQVVSFETPGAVNVQTGAATNLTNSSATVTGIVNPEGIELDECLFEYGTSESYGSTVPCAESTATIGAGNAPVAVHADLTDLTGGTGYHFRLVGKNELGSGQGADAIFKTRAPTIEGESLVEVSETSAELKATVNPNGEETNYAFEYVSETDFNASGYGNATQVPAGGAMIGAGSAGVKVQQELQSLSARTTYHVRVVATNGGGIAVGPEIVFTTYAPAETGLPDGRAYEQTTPVDKNGASVTGGPYSVQAASSGNGITFFSQAPLPGSEGAQAFPTYLSSRSGDGWSTQGFLPPAPQGFSASVLGWSEDLSQSYVAQGARGAFNGTLYQRDSDTRALTAITTPIGANVEANAYAGTSADNSVVLFDSNRQLVDAAAPDSFNTYVWDRTTGTLRLTGALNEVAGNLGQAPAEGSGAGSGGPKYEYVEAQHAISADGSRAFFTAHGNRQIYLRQNPTQPQSPLAGGACTVSTDACTYQVSAPMPGAVDPNGEQAPTFWGATPDGSAAFFSSPGKLTADAGTGPGDEGSDLYRYNVGGHQLVDLTPNPSSGPKGADVQGVLGYSDDGSSVYFVANGILAPGASAGGCGYEHFPGSQQSGNGSCNLYLWHGGPSPSVTFIAHQDFNGVNFTDAQNLLVGPNPYLDVDRGRTSRVSPDGRTLLFRSQEKLTSYNSAGIPEYYRYNIATGLDCVSCNPSGLAPFGPPSLTNVNPAFDEGSGFPVLARNLASDGSRVFFQTPDALVARDSNGRGDCPKQGNGSFSSGVLSCQDVYEWEAKGAGSCRSEDDNGGCLYLISSGTSTEASQFADASPSGNDVFIYTGQPLVLQDRDRLVDIYDARVAGGIASQNELPAVHCQGGDSCRAELPQPPASQSPGSAGFAGPPNLKPKHNRKKHRRHKGHHRKQKKGKRHESATRAGRS
jgi:hypothetical protein